MCVSRARRRSLFSLRDVLRAPMLGARALRRWDYPIFVAEKELGERLLSKVCSTLTLALTFTLTTLLQARARPSGSSHASRPGRAHVPTPHTFAPPSDAPARLRPQGHHTRPRLRTTHPLSTTRTSAFTFLSISILYEEKRRGLACGLFDASGCHMLVFRVITVYLLVITD